MFDLDRVTADQGSTLDIAAIVALIGWTLVELLVLALLRVFDRRRSRRSDRHSGAGADPLTADRVWPTS